MDFFTMRVKENKKGLPQIYPDWIVGRSKDLMVRGRSFYAVWDEQNNLWSTDEYDVQRLVDEELRKEAERLGPGYEALYLRSFNTNVWQEFRKFLQNISDNSHPLDQNLTFANTEVTKKDYVSRRLPYSLESGSTSAWDELLSVLYAPEERAKIEWAIGAVVSGDSKKIQKFMVFYGPAGSGKSTVLNIIQKLFGEYVITFDAKALGSSSNAFSMEVFKSNPLVAIQHDGDLSRIDDNSRINSIVSHETMTVNEKFKPSYSSKVNAFLFMGTNQPVKISDAKSGLLRRLIDVHPTGNVIENARYHQLMQQVTFELGAIAHKCLNVYNSMGANYYSAYRPVEMMIQTDVFYNFVEAYFDVFKHQDGVTLKQSYQMYKTYCLEAGVEKVLPQYKFRAELRNYFERFYDSHEVNGERMRSYYDGFKGLDHKQTTVTHKDNFLVFMPYDPIYNVSRLDLLYSNMPAQLAKPNGLPGKSWTKVTTTLSDIDTTQLHWVKVPEHHIVIDFDLVDEDGQKSLEANLAAAAEWPPTYAELSKSGKGIHLHYIYTGNVAELSNVWDVGIEIKTLLGDSSLRRLVSSFNDKSIATLSGGLPLKEKRMLEAKTIKTEKGLRDLIERNLRKEIMPGTKPSIDFIAKILEDAYESGITYDVRDLRPRVVAFAANSTNQSDAALKVAMKMQYVSRDVVPDVDLAAAPIVFFDVEVFSNLFVVCWKYEGTDNVVRMINPEPKEIEALFNYRLIGFNNRRYDNHILYARYLGYSNEDLYKLSQRIVGNDETAYFGAAFNISFADIYDFSSVKQSLKKFEIGLGIFHLELDIPWDKPVPDDQILNVVEYCVNDVVATEAVFNDRRPDYVAREILSKLSGLSMNSTTQQHTAAIIFGKDKTPQNQFIYTNLAEMFPGYEFNGKESTYRGETVGEGGYVYAEAGMYENVTVLDVASMHPTSIEQLDLFGPYTKNFAALKEARVAIKRKEYERARSLLDGRLHEFLVGAETDPQGADGLAYALKIVINIVYGLTAAKFPNPFRDRRNLDNIVAKRGALFMINLRHEVQARGFTVAHIKTDSIKIPDATPEIIAFVEEYGRQYGYEFENEGTYERFCLVNDAVFVARKNGKWEAVGAQFQHPYVFKTLFSKEDLVFDDYCENRSVTKGVMYLNFMDYSTDPPSSSEMRHVGKTGSFVPVLKDGGVLWRVNEDKQYAVAGTKGHLWMEREIALQSLPNVEIDTAYFEKLVADAVDAIEYYGSFERFIH